MDRIDFWLDGLDVLFKWCAYFIALFLSVLIIKIIYSKQKNKQKNRIQTENGIQEKFFVTLGGEKQYIYISGENKDNPVILFLHGGPGTPTTCLAYYYQKELEKDYVIVNWEQRGCGRTYRKSGRLTVDLLQSDLNELVHYLFDLFGKKIILMGHSWGTVLASEYAYHYPEYISIYIALSQVVHLVSGTMLTSQKAADQASEKRKSKDAEKIRKMVSLFQKAETVNNKSVSNYMKLRTKIRKYLPDEKLKTYRKMLWYGAISPDYSVDDFNWQINCISIKNYFELQRPLIEYMMNKFDVRKIKEYQVPVYFISGTQDWITPVEPIEDYYNEILAPRKKMIEIEHAGHDLYIDQPEMFANAVKTMLQK